MSELLYVYGFVPPAADEAAIGVTGIGGAGIELVDSDEGPQAVVSRLDSTEYGAEVIDARLNDLAWVGTQAAAHERVVAWFVDRGDILPAPLFTLYSSEDALRRVLDAKRSRLEGELSRLHALREWDLKVACDRATLARNAGRYIAAIDEIDREIESAAAGKRFLLARKRDDVLRKELAATAHRLASQALDELKPFAREIVRLPLPAEDMPVVLSAALLVDAQQEPSLIAHVEAVRAKWLDAGLTIDFSGPWAPYRFIAPDTLGQI